MSAERIERRDAFGEPYELLTGAALRHELGTTWEPTAIAGVLSDTVLPTFTEEQAVEAAMFLLKAAKVDIVGAARRLVGALELIEGDADKVDPVAVYRERAAVRASLAAMLAKLEGDT
jgi:hypothetical protein